MMPIELAKRVIYDYEQSQTPIAELADGWYMMARKTLEYYNEMMEARQRVEANKGPLTWEGVNDETDRSTQGRKATPGKDRGPEQEGQ